MDIQRKLSYVLPILLFFLAGCAYFRVDLQHFLLLSDRITSLEQEKEILELVVAMKRKSDPAFGYL